MNLTGMGDWKLASSVSGKYLSAEYTTCDYFRNIMKGDIPLLQSPRLLLVDGSAASDAENLLTQY
jgi:hypothetical protein